MAHTNGGHPDDRSDIFRADCPHVGAFLLVFGAVVDMAPIRVDCPLCGPLHAKPRTL